MGVQEDEVGFGCGDGVEGVLAAGRPFDGVTLFFQEFLQRIGTGCVVINNKDKSPLGQGRSP